jgi:hypothetical protein
VGFGNLGLFAPIEEREGWGLLILRGSGSTISPIRSIKTLTSRLAWARRSVSTMIRS